MNRATFLAGVAALGAGTAACTQAPTAAGDPAHVRIATLGDSLLLGVGAVQPENAFVFRAFLELERRFPNAELVSFAAGGATVADVRHSQVPRARRYPADVVLICAGANDVAAAEDPVAFSFEYDRLLRSLRRSSSARAVVCCGIPDLAASARLSEGQRAVARELRRLENGGIRRLADRYGWTFVPATPSDRPLRRAEIAEDGWHPNDDGYAVMAQALSGPLLAAARRAAR